MSAITGCYLDLKPSAVHGKGTPPGPGKPSSGNNRHIFTSRRLEDKQEDNPNTLAETLGVASSRVVFY